MNNEKKLIYDREIDFRINTADYFIVQSIEDNSKVLELGCATGYITKYLNSKKKCENSAIEINKDALIQVEHLLKFSINSDLNNISSWIDKIPDGYFDYIVCQDVLEHLIEPFDVLSKIKSKLAKNGKILISIPNVNHNTIIMQLLKGRFDYKDIGILDKTHIKFYTKETFSEEARKCGLTRIGHYITYLVPEGTGWNTQYRDHSIDERMVLLKNGDGHVFQNLFILGKCEEFKEEAPLYQLNIDDYDELRIFENDKVKLYFYNNNEEIEYVIIDENTNCIEIEPTIRLCEYDIDIYINNKKYELSVFSSNDGNINKDTGRFINLDTQKLKINYNFSCGDVIKLIIRREDNLEKKLIRGEVIMKNEINIIKQIIDKHDVISFDIFDTLVFRNVLFPKDIFKILDKYVLEKYKIDNFFNIRVNAEENARRNSKEEDVTIEEIYIEIKKIINIDINKIMEKELELEERFIVANPVMKIIFDYVKEQNKRIFIISDMYLSKAYLGRILNKLGYTGFEELFVSSDVKKTKANKSIYEHIIKLNPDIKLNTWLHIGDNIQSDVKNAKSMNLNSYYYKAIRDRIKFEYNEETIEIEESIMRAVQFNKIYCGLDIPYWEKFGMEYIAPIYYGMADWIARMNKESENVVFLSRDGYIPKLVFDKIKIKRKLNNVESKYLYTSRKAYQLPGMFYLSKGEVVECLTQSSEAFGHNLTIKEMFKNASLEVDKYSDILNDFGFNSKNDVINIENRHNAKKLIQFIYSDIMKVAEEKCAIVKKYLEQEGLFEYERVNIVDIGWRGSIQYSIQNYMDSYYKSKNIDKKANIFGYYLGTNQFVYGDIVDNTFGYYFDYSIPWENSSFCLDNLMMYELIFTCPQPQLIGFQEKDEVVEPIFRDFIENKEYISKLQKGALTLIDELIEYDEYISGISVKACTEMYRQFIINKNYDDMKEFRKISNFVSYETEEKPYVREFSQKEVIEKKELIYEECKFNLWKNAFVIEGIETEEEYREFLQSNNIRKDNSSYENIHPKFISKRNVIKGLKNPIKGIRIILKKIIFKIIS